MVSEKQLQEFGVVNWSVLAKDFNGADLLLGNGFSINMAGHFDYNSLFEEFLKNFSAEDRKKFKKFSEKFGTTSFEFILENLRNTKDVNAILQIKTSDEIDEAIECLKTGLVTALHTTHPRSDVIDREQLERIADQLSGFNDIFTLNYDLFLYHIIMILRDKHERDKNVRPYNDYFWGKYKYSSEFKKFMDYQNYTQYKQLYYLHGALFLFREPPDTLKLTRADDSKELIELIGDSIRVGKNAPCRERR